MCCGQNLDNNGDGILNRDEISAELDRLGVALSIDEQGLVLDVFDVNKDGRVDGNELYLVIRCFNQDGTITPPKAARPTPQTVTEQQSKLPTPHDQSQTDETEEFVVASKCISDLYRDVSLQIENEHSTKADGLARLSSAQLSASHLPQIELFPSGVTSGAESTASFVPTKPEDLLKQLQLDVSVPLTPRALEEVERVKAAAQHELEAQFSAHQSAELARHQVYELRQQTLQTQLNAAREARNVAEREAVLELEATRQVLSNTQAEMERKALQEVAAAQQQVVALHSEVVELKTEVSRRREEMIQQQAKETAVLELQKQIEMRAMQQMEANAKKAAESLAVIEALHKQKEQEAVHLQQQFEAEAKLAREQREAQILGLQLGFEESLAEIQRRTVTEVEALHSEAASLRAQAGELRTEALNSPQPKDSSRAATARTELQQLHESYRQCCKELESNRHQMESEWRSAQVASMPR